MMNSFMTTENGVFLEKLIVSQLLKKLPVPVLKYVAVYPAIF